MPLRTFSTNASTLRVYVCPETATHDSKPILRAISPSSARTLLSSPLNSIRKLAPVPVVPLQPSGFRRESSNVRRSKSIRKSCSHSVARLPTVVGCAA